jgi:hypothetical protein
MNPQTIKDFMEYHMCTYEEAADILRDMCSMNYDRVKDDELVASYELEMKEHKKPLYPLEDLPF